MGADHRDQGADGNVAFNHQDAAEQVEQERRCLIENVVQRLDHVFALKDLEANVVDIAQPGSEAAKLQIRGIVGVDIDNAGDRFADMVAQMANFAQPRLAQGTDPLLQFWNHIYLNGI